ncbi:synaptonemal complex protein 2-like [Dunckerocampus dactyliophorus]|uniref:synaptonemal complex protein 2-like n=1 Tax=Dunckerocampus dactyliophorus TaxID=161453 RepID=UPI002406AC51|nr:synaptonemal complex protein 2-like [Dunckerocampus dactyliophorus]
MMEALMEDCLIRGDSSQLVSVLRKEGMTNGMLTRLAQLVQKQLSGTAYDKVAVVLKSLEILVENKDDLKMLLGLGVISKVLLWFQTLRDVLITNPQRSSAQLLTLIESFYDFLLLLSQSPLPVTQLSVLLLELLQMVLEPEVPFTLRLEAIRTFNSILESVSRGQRRRVQMEHTHMQKM